MRLAVTIIGILVSLLIIVLGFGIYAVSDAFGQEGHAQAASLGWLVGVIALVGSALAIGVPRASVGCFGVAGFLALVVIDKDYWPDMTIYGVVMLVLGTAAFFGWKQKDREEAEKAAERARQEERDRQLTQLLAAQRVAIPQGRMADDKPATRKEAREQGQVTRW